MNNIILHPGIILIASGLLCALVPLKIRRVFSVIGPACSLAVMFLMEVGTTFKLPFINGLELVIINVDKLNWVFGLIFCIMAFIGAVYAMHKDRRLDMFATQTYAGSALGVTLCGDWVTLLFFWELMAAASLFIIWANKTEKARRAGSRYIMVHMFGGNSLLIGIVLKAAQGDILLSNLTGTHDLAFWFIILGVAINAAIPPLSGWLTDAYPEGTITGSVFLSSFTTKVAVYCLIRIFAGTEFLIWAGVIMAIYGALYAIIENDMRRLLSYHIISQVGFMVAGVGLGTALAIDGATAHAFSHILYKSLLFMCAGAIIYATGVRKINQLGGLAKKMPAVCAFFFVAAFSIAGVPFFNGFISKSITVTAAFEAGYPMAELGLQIASVGTFLSIVLKMGYFIFFGKDRELEVQPLPKNMYVGMAMGAALCVLFGVCPELLYNILPYAIEYHPFTLDHIIQYVQLLGFAIIPFLMYLDHMEPYSKISLDTDWFYRKPFTNFVKGVSTACVRIQFVLATEFRQLYLATLEAMKNPFKGFGFVRKLQLENVEVAEGEYNPDSYRSDIGTVMIVALAIFIATVAVLVVAL